MEQGEIVQRVGADRVFGRLHLAVLPGGHQLGADLGVEHRLQHVLGILCQRGAVVGVGDHPADEVLDEGLRHSRVDGVVAHLVADAVRRPAERQLGEVGGADDEPAVLVREAEQKIGARPRLHVLERHVVHRLAVGVGVMDAPQ